MAIVLISVGVDLWWLHHFRDGYPLDIDESRYLELGLRLSDSLTTHGPAAFWHVWSGQQEFGPLLPLVSVPVYVVLGRSLFGGLAAQLAFLVLLVFSSYGIGTRLTSRTGGTIVAIVVACTPAIIDFSRSYQFALTDAAVLAAATYALLASEAFTRRGWSCAWGVLLGLTPLARTMAIAFLPAQLIAAGWLIIACPRIHPRQIPGNRRPQVLNLGLGLGLGVMTAATWLARSWHSVYHYLTSFGYGAQSASFSNSGSRLTVGYWTREAVNAVRQDLYLPLAALPALCLLVALTAALRKHRRQENRHRDSDSPAEPAGRIPAGLRSWAASDGAIVLFILIEAYVVISSSRNEGVGFRVPLIPMLVALVVAGLIAVPWRIPRRLLIGGLIGVSAVNLIMKADVVGSVSADHSANVPGLGTVPVLAGQGYIQSYVVGSLEARAGSATQPLPVSQRGWLPAYSSTVDAILRLARRGHYAPVVGLATDEPLINANDFTLAARLHHRRDLIVTLLPGPKAATLPGYERLLRSAPATPNILITVNHVGFSYYARSGLTDIEQGLLERASAALGFRCGAGITLPDGRIAVVSWRTRSPSPGPKDDSCSPRVTETNPAAGAATAHTAAPVSAVFSLPMQTASLRDAFTLTASRTGRPVLGTVSSFGDIALVFRPRRPLAPGARFTATISTAAAAATGAPVRSAMQWSFTTRR